MILIIDVTYRIHAQHQQSLHCNDISNFQLHSVTYTSNSSRQINLHGKTSIGMNKFGNGRFFSNKILEIHYGMLTFNTSSFQENSKSQAFPCFLSIQYNPNSKTLCFSANFHSLILRIYVKPSIISTFLKNVAAPRWNCAVNLMKRLYWTQKFNTLISRCELKCHFHNNSSSTRYSDIEMFQVHQLLELYWFTSA